VTKQQRQLVILAAVILALLAVYFLANKKSSKQETPGPQTSQAPGASFHGIPPEGDGGDPELNKLKNRWSAPESSHNYSVSDIIGFNHDRLDIAAREHRNRWSRDEQSQASQYEGQGVTVEGFLIAAKESGPEACNGHSDVYRDFHIWIGTSPNSGKNESIVVELTPFWEEQYPELTIRRFESLTSSHPKVRVTGWILWDEEHADEVGKSRGSQWEVHPVTKFEEIAGN
jgi:hypothetical protein